MQAVDGAYAGSPWATAGSFHIDGADLAISKTVDKQLAQTGDSLQYTLTFTNNGPDTLNDVIVTDTLPLSLSNISYQRSGIAVTELNTNPYVWQVDPIAAGQSGSLVIEGQINGSFDTAGQYIANTAQISSAAYDNELANNETGVMVYPNTGTICTGYPAVVLADGPVGYWRLSDATDKAINLGSIGSAIDASYHGATPATGLIWLDPTLGAKFDGVDDYILIPNHHNIIGASTAKTIEIWFQTPADLGVGEVNSSTQGTYMLYEQGDGFNGLNIFIRAFEVSGEIEYVVMASIAGPGNYLTRAVGGIRPGASYHLALVYNAGRVSVYLNGNTSFDNANFASSINAHNDGDIRIGANGDSFIFWMENTNLHPFIGTIDEVAVYNTALTSQQISAHYSACQNVDLSLRKTALNRIVDMGDSLTYTLSFINNGYESASNVVISDTLPSALINVSTAWQVDTGLNLVESSTNPHQWTLTSLASGQGGIITIIGQVSNINSSIEAGDSLVNTADISTTSDEFNKGNNKASVTVGIATPTPTPTPDPTFIKDESASANLPGLYRGDVDWADADEDGDLDVALAGHSGVYRLARLYEDDGANNFSDLNAGLPGVEQGSIDWGDYDGDGDLDVLLTGNAGNVKMAAIYRNDNGSFVNLNAGLTAVHRGNGEWGEMAVWIGVTMTMMAI